MNSTINSINPILGEEEVSVLDAYMASHDGNVESDDSFMPDWMRNPIQTETAPRREGEGKFINAPGTLIHGYAFGKFVLQDSDINPNKPVFKERLENWSGQTV